MDVPKLKRRSAESHKGTYGRVLIVGGSRGMTGAVCLSGSAALRSGAGLVSVAIPDRCLETVAAYEPNYMTVALPDTGDGQFSAGATQKLVELANHSTSVGIGPGMSRSEAINKLVADAYEKIRVPAVFDADALNALAQLDGGLPKARGPRVLTPHVGEFRRLVRDDTLSPAECRACAPEFACRHGVIVVLKGHRSLVTDGQTTHENDTGNPGMATGGSGDVLTGVISSLLSQDLSPLDAAILGVHVHGLAGDIACSKFGEVSLDAENVKDCLSEAFMKLADD